MKIVFSFLVSLVTAMALTSCGGGGGGGGGSSSHGVRVVHSAIDAAPADLTSSAQPGVVLQSTHFGESSQYVAVPDGQQNFTVSVRGSSILTASATVSGSDKLSLLLFEATRDSNVNVALLSDVTPKLSGTESAVRVVHGVRALDGLVVTVNGTPVATPVERAQGSAYVVIPAGLVSVTASNNGRTVYSGTFALAAKSSYSVLVTGEAGYFVGGELLQD